jgi:hypothetical protein
VDTEILPSKAMVLIPWKHIYPITILFPCQQNSNGKKAALSQ